MIHFLDLVPTMCLSIYTQTNRQTNRQTKLKNRSCTSHSPSQQDFPDIPPRATAIATPQGISVFVSDRSGNGEGTGFSNDKRAYQLDLPIILPDPHHQGPLFFQATLLVTFYGKVISPWTSARTWSVK